MCMYICMCVHHVCKCVYMCCVYVLCICVMCGVCMCGVCCPHVVALTWYGLCESSGVPPSKPSAHLSHLKRDTGRS